MYDQILQGLYGNKDSFVRKGGWKEAYFEIYVRRDIQEINAWIKKYDVLNGTIGSLAIPDTPRGDAIIPRHDGIEDI